jgi:hypothetical protein
MATLVIDDDDIKRATPPEAGWHLFEIKDFEAKDRKKSTPPKEGFEYTFTLEVLKSSPDSKEDNVGRQIQTRFYSTGMGFMLPFVSAVMEQPITKKIEFDPDKFVGKPVMAEVVKSIYLQKEQRKPENFAPASGCPF